MPSTWLNLSLRGRHLRLAPYAHRSQPVVRLIHDSSADQVNEGDKLLEEYTSGTRLIVGATNTGKSFLLSSLATKLCASKGNQDVIMLTASDRNALSLRHLMDLKMPLGSELPRIETFHSFGHKLLKKYMNDKRTVLTTYEISEWLLDHVHKFKLKSDSYALESRLFINSLLNAFSRIQQSSLTPEEYTQLMRRQIAKSAETQPDFDAQAAEATVQEVVNAFLLYQQLKTEHQLMDFNDQLSDGLRLLDKYGDTIPYLLVDELHDCSAVGLYMVEKLSGAHRNVVAAGDPFQRTALLVDADDRGPMERFLLTFPNTPLVHLREHYRGPPQVLQSVTNLLESNKRLVMPNSPKRQHLVDSPPKSFTVPELIPFYPLPSPVHQAADSTLEPLVHRHFENSEQEFEWVAEYVQKLVNEHGFDCQDIAIVFRARRYEHHIEEALKRLDIPILRARSPQLLDHPSIRLVLDVLIALGSEKDETAKQWRTLAVTYYGIPEAELTARGCPPGQGITFDILKPLLAHPSFHIASCTRRLLRDIRKFQELQKSDDIVMLTKYVMRQLGITTLLSQERRYGDTQHTADQMDQEKRRIQQFMTVIDQAVQHVQSSRPGDVIPELIRLQQRRLTPVWRQRDTFTGVHLCTPLQARGLQCRCMILPTMTSSHYPGMYQYKHFIDWLPSYTHARSRAHHIEDGKRLVYMLATRASDQVVFVSSSHYTKSKKSYKPSPFLADLLNIPLKRFENDPRWKPLTKGAEQRQDPSIWFHHWFKSSRRTMRRDALPAKLPLTVESLIDYKRCPKRYFYAHVVDMQRALPTAERAEAAALDAILNTCEVEHLQQQHTTSEYTTNRFLSQFRSRESSSEPSPTDLPNVSEEEGVIKSYTDSLEKWRENTDLTSTVAVNRRFEWPITDSTWIAGRWPRVVAMRNTENDSNSAESIDQLELYDVSMPSARKVKNTDTNDEVALPSTNEILTLVWNAMHGPHIKQYQLHSQALSPLSVSPERSTYVKSLLTAAVDGINQKAFKAKPTISECQVCPFQFICRQSLTRPRVRWGTHTSSVDSGRDMPESPAAIAAKQLRESKKEKTRVKRLEKAKEKNNNKKKKKTKNGEPNYRELFVSETGEEDEPLELFDEDEDLDDDDEY